MCMISAPVKLYMWSVYHLRTFIYFLDNEWWNRRINEIENVKICCMRLALCTSEYIAEKYFHS